MNRLRALDWWNSCAQCWLLLPFAAQPACWDRQRNPALHHELFVFLILAQDETTRWNGKGHKKLLLCMHALCTADSVADASSWLRQAAYLQAVLAICLLLLDLIACCEMCRGSACFLSSVVFKAHRPILECFIACIQNETSHGILQMQKMMSTMSLPDTHPHTDKT